MPIRLPVAELLWGIRGLMVATPPFCKESSSMIRTLKELFASLAAPAEAAPAAREHTLQLATAVLLVEMMRADARIDPDERGAVIKALQGKFGLGEDEVARLLELAQATANDAPDLFAFTSQLNRGFDLTQKLRMTEYLWQVAYADGHLSHHENQLMLKLGDLLYIPRGEFVAAKQRARAAAGLEAPALPQGSGGVDGLDLSGTRA